MYMITSHPYNTRSENVDDKKNTSSTTSSVTTSETITSLETKLLSRFDELSNELLNVKDVIIKNLQSEDQLLKEKISSLENKIISLETSQNILEQYGRRNNIKISGIPDSQVQ